MTSLPLRTTRLEAGSRTAGAARDGRRYRSSASSCVLNSLALLFSLAAQSGILYSNFSAITEHAGGIVFGGSGGQ
jgi:hypothetical protein